MRTLSSRGGATQGPWKLVAPALLVVASLAATARAGTRGPLPTPSDFVSTDCAPRPEPRLAVHLVWFDYRGLLPGDAGDVEREVRSLFCRLGIDVEWETGASGRVLNGNARVPQIPVILRKRSPRRLEIMGQVPEDARVSPAVWVYLDGVKAALGVDGRVRRGRSGAVVARALSTAVARVAAHEVIHALAPFQPHAVAGLMRSSLGRSALLGPRRLSIDAQLVFAVQSALKSRAEPFVHRARQRQPVDRVMLATIPPI